MKFPTLALLVAAGVACAEPMMHDLIDVPLARLIANAEQRIKEDPTHVESHHQLARLHGMAYAWKRTGPEAKAKAERSKPDEPFFWYGVRVPFTRVKPPADDAQKQAAAKHLEQAITVYARALKLDPKPWPLRLGHAWCLKEAGKAKEAKAALRAIVKDAWASEKAVKHGSEMPFVTAEAIRYLKPLLDPKVDAEELADLDAKAKHLESIPRAITPIVVPLAAGLAPEALVDREARVCFDLDGSGRRLAWEWITPRAAWLVWDPRGTGEVRSATQLFGSRSFTLFQASGYAALALLDDDRDGWLRGPELAGLALWRDADADGVSDPGEVRPLAAWHVTGLSCGASTHASGIAWSERGVEFADGSVRASFDVILQRK